MQTSVRLEILPTNPANRIPLLSSNKLDLVLANFTITEERAKQVDFSIPYFASGQKVIAKKALPVPSCLAAPRPMLPVVALVPVADRPL